jgi:hypothetical protein
VHSCGPGVLQRRCSPKTIKNPNRTGTPKNIPVPVAELAKSVCVAIAKTKMAQYPMFLDTAWYDGKTKVGDPGALAVLFRKARSAGLLAIPVVRSTYDHHMLHQLRKEGSAS